MDASTLTGSIDVGGMLEGEHTANLQLNLDSKFTSVKNTAVTVDIVPKGTGEENASEETDSEKKETEQEEPSEADTEKKNTKPNS